MYGGNIEKGFHPSGISGQVCPRRLVYLWHEVPKNNVDSIMPRVRRIFDNGSYTHDRWQFYLSQLGKHFSNIELVGDWKCKGCGLSISPDTEIPMPTDFICPDCKSERIKYNEFRLSYPELRLVGKRDAKFLVDTGTEQFSMLGEIKSINTFAFKKLYSANNIDISYLKQINFYMLMDGTEDALFIFEDKNDQNVNFLHVKQDLSIIQPEIDSLVIANKAIDDAVIPDRLSNYPKNPHCKACGFSKVCELSPSLEDLLD